MKIKFNKGIGFHVSLAWEWYWNWPVFLDGWWCFNLGPLHLQLLLPLYLELDEYS